MSRRPRTRRHACRYRWLRATRRFRRPRPPSARQLREASRDAAGGVLLGVLCVLAVLLLLAVLR